MSGQDVTSEVVDKAAQFFDIIQKARDGGNAWWADAQMRQIYMHIENDRKIREQAAFIWGALGVFEVLSAISRHLDIYLDVVDGDDDLQPEANDAMRLKSDVDALLAKIPVMK